MGKASRAACIFTPWALSVAAFVCIVLVNLGGSNKSSSTLNGEHFVQVDFSNYTGGSSGSSDLAVALAAAKEAHLVADFYNIHLWNYCNGTSSSSGNGTTEKVEACSKREKDFYFDPLRVWGLEGVLNSTSSDSSGVLSEIADKADGLLDDGLAKALDTYRSVSRGMFIAYYAALWLLLATVLCGVLALFTRVLGFVTWILSGVSTVAVFAASVVSTALFATLAAALKTALRDAPGVEVKLGSSLFATTWLAVVFSTAATSFWLFTACCCAGKSNPHHVRSNSDPPIKSLGLFGSNGGWGRGKRGGEGYGQVHDGGEGGFAASPFQRHSAAVVGGAAAQGSGGVYGARPNPAAEKSSTWTVSSPGASPFLGSGRGATGHGYGHGEDESDDDDDIYNGGGGNGQYAMGPISGYGQPYRPLQQQGQGQYFHPVHPAQTTQQQYAPVAYGQSNSGGEVYDGAYGRR